MYIKQSRYLLRFLFCCAPPSLDFRNVSLVCLSLALLPPRAGMFVFGRRGGRRTGPGPVRPQCGVGAAAAAAAAAAVAAAAAGVGGGADSGCGGGGGGGPLCAAPLAFTARSSAVRGAAAACRRSRCPPASRRRPASAVGSRVASCASPFGAGCRTRPARPLSRAAGCRPGW